MCPAWMHRHVQNLICYYHTITWSGHSRRIVPITRSTKARCQGLTRSRKHLLDAFSLSSSLLDQSCPSGNDTWAAHCLSRDTVTLSAEMPPRKFSDRSILRTESEQSSATRLTPNIEGHSVGQSNRGQQTRRTSRQAHRSRSRTPCAADCPPIAVAQS